MSDIVCPRIENYVHPKKSVWRHTGYYTMSSNHEKEFMEEDAIYPTDGIEQQSKNQEPQDAPLDFSVKAANTEHEHHTKSRSSQISIKDDGEILQRAESNPQSSNYPNIQKPTEVPIYNKKSSNTETSKYHDPKQSHTNGSTQKYSEHSPENRPSRRDAPVFHGNPVEHSKFQNSNHHIQETNGESFDCNGSNSHVQSSNVSRENSSPGTSSPSRSILQEVLVRSFDERSPMNGFGPYFQNSSPSASSTKSFRGTMSSCFETNPMLPDNGSLLHVAGATFPVPPMISNFGMLNSFPYQTGPINGMNPFINESLPSISMDTKVFQTPGLCDKKSNKPIRPFKAFTQDPLFGITPIGHPNVIGNMPNSRYFRDYFHTPLKETAEQPKQNTVPKKESSDTSGNSAINSSPTSSNIIEHKLDVSGSGDSNSSYADVSGSVIEAAESTSNGNNRKRSRTLPNEVKDEAYWERRRKNNQAAKRSRDARRQKEDMVAHQAWLFRGMNAQLQSRIQNLENQILILREENHSLQENYRKTDIQLRLAKADITRCKHCASRSASNNSENG